MVDATALPNHILSMDDLKVVVERMGEAVKAQKHHRFFEMIGWNQPIRVDERRNQKSSKESAELTPNIHASTSGLRWMV